ncbi:MAG: adenylate/guanylate cyclase domain-containing protein [Lentimicrobiaceae bacterium]|nr:adenylate/guanylate cyclase domain-containing protein [Lentimicrobiaceae bacterium]
MPTYHLLRQYVTAILLYYFLVFPTGMILWLKHSPDWLGKKGLETTTPGALDTLRPQDTVAAASDGSLKFEVILPGENANEGQRHRVNVSFSAISRLAFYTLLLSTVVAYALSMPFKRYFKKKKKGKDPGSLQGICRKYLLATPWMHTGILGIGFLIIHLSILYRVYGTSYSGPDEIEKRLYEQFFYISLVAATLILILVYSWQKHRVHLRYIEHMFSHEELRTRMFRRKPSRIRGRLWTSAAMTSLFPLSIVIFYLFLSLSSIAELGIHQITEEQAGLLFGKYLQMFGNIPKAEFARNFFYVNAIDSVLMLTGIFTGVLISFIYIFFYVRWNTEDIVSPVKELLERMDRTGQGAFGQYAMVRTNDEIGTLTAGYNQMTERMKAYFDDISALNKTYSQFVPRQFLDMLGRQHYGEIRLGDQLEGEMTVLFSDIRSFTTLSEGMSPKESFDYINAYLGWMEPEIRKYNGFIDKYIGDAIMAVFPEKPDDALNAAIAMRHALPDFNAWSMEHKGFGIQTGIGIHTGRLMMGIVGTEGRLNGTVISDAVNIASRLEELNKKFGSAVILSQHALDRLQNPSAFQVRSLGGRILRGKSEPVYVYELLDGEPEMLKHQKTLHRQEYESAIQAWMSGKVEIAMAGFESYLRLVPDDKAARALFGECRESGHIRTA